MLKLAVVFFMSAPAPIPVSGCGGVHKADSKTDGQVVVGGAFGERVRPNGHVKVAGRIVGKRRRTNRHVPTASGILRTASKPMAVLAIPVVRFNKALSPSAVLAPG